MKKIYKRPNITWIEEIDYDTMICVSGESKIEFSSTTNADESQDVMSKERTFSFEEDFDF